MSYFEKNDISIYSNIIYQIYAVEDNDRMRLSFLESVRLLVPYKSCNFYLAARDGKHILSNPVSVDFPIDALAKYLDEIEDVDPARWIFIQAKSMVYREEDMFSEESIKQNVCYQEFYIPNDLHHSLQISLALHGKFLGSVSFYRAKKESRFSDDVLFLFDLLKDHLALRLYKEFEMKPKHIDIDALAYEKKYRLTIREVEVVELLINGYSIEDIGNDLCISSNTVKTHIANIYKKTGISSRYELYRILL